MNATIWELCVVRTKMRLSRKKLRCGKAKKGMDGSEAVCALGVTLHSHSHFSPSYTRGGCFILGSLCSILRFLRKGKLSREEAKVWEGEKRSGQV